MGMAVAGWLLVTGIVPPMAWFCRRFGLLDSPGPRKIHKTPTPRLTGISLFAATWGTIFLAAVLFPARMAEFRPYAAPIFTGAVAILALGVVDDLRPLGAWVKLGVQMVASVPLWMAGIGFRQLWIPFVGGVDLGIWALPVTMIWFLVFVNAVNIIDGIDGLATATSGVATLTLIWITWNLGLASLEIVAAGLFGALVGFWRFNRPPAAVFMGDCGSLSLGYIFAVIALLAPIKRFTALAFFVPLIAMLVPLAEQAISIVRRLISGASPIKADAGHLHHMLLAAGWTPPQVVAAYAIVTAAFGGFCVAFRFGNRRFLAATLGFFVLLLGVLLGIICSRRRAGRGVQDLTEPVNEG
jgi:UDP-GlcNAc:undecaprenyl-phosphate GlcNAc-1-phosphate transferase